MVVIFFFVCGCCSEQLSQYCYEFAKGWNTQRNFCPALQFGKVVASCQNLGVVCRFEMTDFIENCVVHDGNRLRFF